MSVIANTSDDISGRGTTDISGVGIADSAPPPGKAIVQSGIVAQFFGGQGDPSAIAIIGAAVIQATSARAGPISIAASNRTVPMMRNVFIIGFGATPFRYFQYTSC